MDNNGTGMATPPVNEPSGAVTSRQATRKNPRQGGSGFKVDRNKHGIRRETSLNPPQKKTRPKKV
jgi:hypothetical protein